MIVRAVVKLAKGLGLAVVAEGVESEEAFARLRALGCEHVQGYWFGSAMASETFAAGLPPTWTRAARHGVRSPQRIEGQSCIAAARLLKPERGEIGVRRRIQGQILDACRPARHAEHLIEPVEGRIEPDRRAAGPRSVSCSQPSSRDRRGA